MDKDKYRFIKISKQALWEFIYESMTEHQSEFFDVEPTEISSHFAVDFDTGNLLWLVHKSEDSEGNLIALPKDIDATKLMLQADDTTSSLFAPHRYKEMSLKDIICIQNGCDTD